MISRRLGGLTLKMNDKCAKTCTRFSLGLIHLMKNGRMGHLIMVFIAKNKQLIKKARVVDQLTKLAI